MIYPRFVFKNNGPIKRAGGTYDSLLVLDNAGHESAIANGWFDNLDDAINAPVVVKPEPTEDRDHSAPTRAELEQKALELDIKFDGRTTDSKLLERITAALGE